MLKIAVCDDEPAASRQISAYLEQYRQDSGVSFQVFYFSSGEELIESLPQDVKILFLDIQMAGISGIETARKLREAGRELFIFFVTGYMSFALEGYDVHAYAFLKKPLQYASFQQNLTDALLQLKKNARAVLKLGEGASASVIRCDEIIYVEVYKHQTTVFLKSGTREFGVSLSEIETQLNRHGFFRCHKSYLVNMSKVSLINQSEIMMSNGASVPLSKHRRAQFLSAYFTFTGGSL